MVATKGRRDELSRKRKGEVFESIMEVKKQYQEMYPEIDEMIFHNICMSVRFKIKDIIPY